MRVLVFGGTGMLGRAVAVEGRRRGAGVLALSHAQADITDAERVAYYLKAFAPEAVINCAAFTQVDACETERDWAQRVNCDAVGRLADAVVDAGARLVHVSTDYVFDGRAEHPYRETDATGPCSVYGASKLAGEREALAAGALVVRASWLFGPGGSNFAGTIVRLIAEGRTPLRVVDDQIGAPTYTPFLARALWDLAATGAQGVIHYRNREPVSWHGFATAIAAAVRPGTEVLPVGTEAFPRPAPRPAFSVLDTGRFETLLGRPVEPWLAGLTDYLTTHLRTHLMRLPKLPGRAGDHR